MDEADNRTLLKQRLKTIVDRERAVFSKKESLLNSQISDLLQKLAVAEQNAYDYQCQLRSSQTQIHSLQTRVKDLESKLDEQSHRHHAAMKSVQKENDWLNERLAELRMEPSVPIQSSNSKPASSATLIKKKKKTKPKRAPSRPRKTATPVTYPRPASNKPSSDTRSFTPKKRLGSSGDIFVPESYVKSIVDSAKKSRGYKNLERSISDEEMFQDLKSPIILTEHNAETPRSPQKPITTCPVREPAVIAVQKGSTEAKLKELRGNQV
ncbi:hypothetical protein P9112_000878 [Eukaryota sp. TZLM1-RC]